MNREQRQELKEKLLASGSNQYINPLYKKPAKCVLTIKEAENYIKENKRILEIACIDSGIRFFTDNYTFGLLTKDRITTERITPVSFVPVSSAIPMRVHPRKGLTTGVITTLEEYLIVFGKNTRIIQSIDELIDFLIKEHHCE